MKRAIIIFIVLSIAGICNAQNFLPQPNKKGLWGYVNEKGKYLIKPVYQAAEPFSSYLACVKVNGLYGYINQEGQFVISAVYDSAESFVGKYAICSKSNLFGLLASDGEVYLDFEYEQLKISKNKRFYVGKKQGDSRIYVISISSNAPSVHAYEEVSDFNKYSYASVKSDGLYGYMDAYGNILVKPEYLECPFFTSWNVAVTHKSSGYGMIDVSLKNVIDEKYAFVQLAESGNYHYGNSPETFGIISNAGKILLNEGQYKKIDKINSSFFTAIDQEGKYDIIDADGRAILSKCNTISLSGLVVTYSAAQESGKMNLADGRKAVVVKDKEIWSPSKASKISYEDPFVVWIDESGKEHWLTLLGKPVFEEYDEVKTISNGCYVVSKNGKNAIASSSGDILTDWVDAVIPIMEDYVQMAVKRRYGQVCCAIYRASTKKMITGYDFAWVYTPKANGLVPVKLLRGDNLGKTDKLLKMMGDSFYIAGDLSEGFYPITDFKTKKMGVMTEDGKVLVSPKYDEVGDFRCGMCRVWIAEKGNGFINTSGALVVPCKYPYVYDFGTIEGVKNYTQVWDNWGQTFYIDKKGKIADPDKIMREAYDAQRQSSWY